MASTNYPGALTGLAVEFSDAGIGKDGREGIGAVDLPWTLGADEELHGHGERAVAGSLEPVAAESLSDGVPRI
jgi:hypothetical protein